MTFKLLLVDKVQKRLLIRSGDYSPLGTLSRRWTINAYRCRLELYEAA